jgi:hypothetical protein
MGSRGRSRRGPKLAPIWCPARTPHMERLHFGWLNLPRSACLAVERKEGSVLWRRGSRFKPAWSPFSIKRFAIALGALRDGLKEGSGGNARSGDGAGALLSRRSMREGGMKRWVCGRLRRRWRPFGPARRMPTSTLSDRPAVRSATRSTRTRTTTTSAARARKVRQWRAAPVPANAFCARFFSWSPTKKRRSSRRRPGRGRVAG